MGFSHVKFITKARDPHLISWYAIWHMYYIYTYYDMLTVIFYDAFQTFHLTYILRFLSDLYFCILFDIHEVQTFYVPYISDILSDMYSAIIIWDTLLRFYLTDCFTFYLTWGLRSRLCRCFCCFWLACALAPSPIPMPLMRSSLWRYPKQSSIDGFSIINPPF